MYTNSYIYMHRCAQTCTQCFMDKYLFFHSEIYSEKFIFFSLKIKIPVIAKCIDFVASNRPYPIFSITFIDLIMVHKRISPVPTPDSRHDPRCTCMPMGAFHNECALTLASAESMKPEPLSAQLWLSTWHGLKPPDNGFATEG